MELRVKLDEDLSPLVGEPLVSAGRTCYRHAMALAKCAALSSVFLLSGCGPAYWTRERFASDRDYQPFYLQHCTATYTPHPADRLTITFWGPARIPYGLSFRDIVAPPESSVILGNICWAKGQWDFSVNIYNLSGVGPNDCVSFSTYVGDTRKQTFRLQFTQPPNVTVTDGSHVITASWESYYTGSVLSD